MRDSMNARLSRCMAEGFDVRLRKERTMQRFSEKDIRIGKGIAILLILWNGLFSANSVFAGSDAIANWVWPMEITTGIGNFSQIGVSVLMFLFGLQIARYYQDGHFDSKQMAVASFRAYRKLLAAFLPIYILVASTSFLGRDFPGTYGSGLKTWVYAVLDAFGFAGILGTPVLNPAWAYMGVLVAYLLLTPLLMELYGRYRWWVCVLAIASPYILGTEHVFWSYLGVYALGMACAWEPILERLKGYVYQGHETFTMYAKLLLAVGGIGLSYAAMQSVGLNRILNCIMAFGVVYLSYEFISDVESLGKVFAFLGTHSLNLWFVHDMLHRYYFTQQIASLRHTVVIFAVVVLLSLLISMGIEWIKAQIGISNDANAIGIATRIAQQLGQKLPSVKWKNLRIAMLLHFACGLIYVMYRVVNHDLNGTRSLQVLDANISDGLEHTLFYVITVIMGGILIYSFWKIVWIICSKWNQLSGKKIFFACLFLGLFVVVLSYPGMYAYEVDNYYTYYTAMTAYPNYWHGAYTSYYYLACHMFLPHPISLPIVQYTSFHLVLFYCYNQARKDKAHAWSGLYFFLLAVPEALYVALNPYRNCMYTILCLFLLAYIYFEYRLQHKLSKGKWIALLLAFAFTAIWRNEGIIFSLILFTGALLIVYRQKLSKVALSFLLLLVCIRIMSIPQDLGTQKFWGSDYTMINAMNPLQDIFNAADANLNYENAEEDLAAIEAIAPIEMIKESGISGYRSYNASCGRDINQSCASEEAQSAFMKAYMNLTLHNLPVFCKARWEDYKAILFWPFPRHGSSYEGEYYVFPNGTFKGWDTLITHSPLTQKWEGNPVRNMLLRILDRTAYFYFWMVSELKLAVIGRIALNVLFCIGMFADFGKSIWKKSKEHLFPFLLEAAIFLEYCAIVLVMPEPRAQYFYPMQFCIYFMVIARFLSAMRQRRHLSSNA